MRVRIKICGITRLEDALVAVNLGVDALGFNFFEKSPRYIRPESAREIIAAIPPFVAAVGVFVDAPRETILNTIAAAGLSSVQLHGSETPQLCSSLPVPVIKVFPVSPEFQPADLDPYCCAGYLLDTWSEYMKGGTGAIFDWRIAAKVCATYRGVVLAGGLGPSNLLDALESVRPYAVDINSGVEIRPGIKNPHKLRDAVKIVNAFA